MPDLDDFISYCFQTLQEKRSEPCNINLKEKDRK